MNRKKRKQLREQKRLQKLSTLLAASVEPEPLSASPSIMNLENMITVCRDNWSNWFAQVTAARIDQVATLSRAPSVEQVEILLDLEKLGKQMEQV